MSTVFTEKYGPGALVTGASSGIGRAFAESLAALGMDLVLVARRVGLMETLAAHLRAAHGVEVEVCAMDLAEAGAAQRIADATASLDIGLVVSNAGFGLNGEHSANDPGAMTEMLMVNCHAPMQLMHRFIPRLRKRGTGGIILTGSVEGLIGCPYSAAYSASKAFVKSFGEALWGELTPQGIDVLAICPGATDTEALGRHGIDPATLPNVMQPRAVADLALENLQRGPVLIAGEHYRATFERLLSMPRRDALTAMAARMQGGH
jgi:short-subunit dehydrogenase